MNGLMVPDSKLSVESFARHCKEQVIPVNKALSYFSVIPLEDNELRRLVYDPASAAPPRLTGLMPHVNLIIVAYLEKPARKTDGVGPMVVFKKPPRARRLASTLIELDKEAFLFIAVKDEDVADYHDALYREMSGLLAERLGENGLGRDFRSLLRQELKDEVRGEIDDPSWQAKQRLLQKQSDPKKDTKLLRDYVEQSMIDTLSLYLHGLCCDIDVEAGPRQLASPLIRKRLELFRESMPPPKGVALFPEELDPPL